MYTPITRKKSGSRLGIKPGENGNDARQLEYGEARKWNKYGQFGDIEN